MRDRAKSKALEVVTRCYLPGEERGASIVEYTFLLVLVAVVAIVGLRYFGVTVSGSLGNSGSSVHNAITNSP